MTTTISGLDDFKALDPFFSHHREGPRRHCGWWALLRPAGRRRHLRLHHHDSRLPKARRRPQGRRRALPPLRHHDRPRPMSRPRGPSRHQDRRRGARVRLHEAHGGICLTGSPGDQTGFGRPWISHQAPCPGRARWICIFISLHWNQVPSAPPIQMIERESLHPEFHRSAFAASINVTAIRTRRRPPPGRGSRASE